MNRIRNFILGRDMFGHAISLNFDRNGEYHRTIVTGLFSLFLKSCITLYVILRFKMLILNE